MDRQKAAIKESIDALNSFEGVVSQGNIKSPEVIAQRMNAFMQSLQNLQSTSRCMDEVLNMQIPIELIEQLDKLDGNSPDLYQQRLLQEAMEKKDQMKKKAKFLNDVKTSIEDELNKDD